MTVSLRTDDHDWEGVVPVPLPAAGPIAAEITRFLAVRPDLASPGLRRRLLAVRPRIAACPWEQMGAVLHDQFGPDLSTTFDKVRSTPISATAVAQVHEARLRDGTEVVLKMVRPDAAQMIAATGSWRTPIDAVLAEDGPVEDEHLDDVVAELTRWMERRADMTRELANIERLREATRKSAWEYVAPVYDELCSPQILVTERVPGLPVDELLGLGRSQRRHDPDRLEEFGIDPPRLARHLVALSYRQLFRYRFFQLDFHPRNLIAVPGDRFAFVDHSNYGTLDPADGREQLDYVAAILDDDLAVMVEPPGLDEVIGRAELATLRRELVRTAGSGAVGGTDAPRDVVDEPAVATFLDHLLRATRSHGYELPEGGRLAYQSLITASELAVQLDPDTPIDAIGSEYVRVAYITTTLRQFSPEDVESSVLSMITLARESPANLQKITSDLAEGTFSLNVYVSEANEVIRNRNRRTRLIVSAVLTVCLAIVLSTPDLPDPVRWGVSALFALAFAAVFVGSRRLR